jgi:hypothetical protein
MDSTIRQQADHLLGQLAAQVGLPGCALDEAGGASLALDDVVISLHLEEATGRLLLLAPIGTPARPEVRTLSALLAANLLWAGTQGATVAMDPHSLALVLQHAIAVPGAEIAALEAVLTGMADTVARLRAMIARPEAETLPMAALPSMAGMIRG